VEYTSTGYEYWFTSTWCS